ncbi:Helix-turn-helix protein [Frankia canadensis]|uniref:Helix-turn-helix protein n=2 Tax=Frankia canadensis TaxID=1836972 RepID=A0A2I2KVX9_9ACTN|nr:Helix-turn-helix protein [Frankia canadensis]SOU57110.1 Helix-turn-helix protein [Frankia canadensis]
MTMAGRVEVPLLRRLVGQALRRRRLTQGRTLRDVADAARVSMPYLSEIERGLKEASSEVLAAICRALHVRLADLLDEVRQELARIEPEIVPAGVPVAPPARGAAGTGVAGRTAAGASFAADDGVVPPRAAAGFLGEPRRRTAAVVGESGLQAAPTGALVISPLVGPHAGGAVTGGVWLGGATAGGPMTAGPRTVGSVRVLEAPADLGRCARYQAVLGIGRVVVPAGPRSPGTRAVGTWVDGTWPGMAGSAAGRTRDLGRRRGRASWRPGDLSRRAARTAASPARV